MDSKYMFCSNCERKIPRGIAFCPYCGSKQQKNKLKPNNNHKKDNQSDKTIGGIPYTTDDDNPKKIQMPDYIKAKPGQQTWNSFYSKHRILVLITAFVVIILLIGGGIKKSTTAYHNYEYPTTKLPPSIANSSHPFNNGLQINMHTKTFNTSDNGDDTTYSVDNVTYSGSHVTVDCHNVNDPDDSDSYGNFVFTVKGGNITFERSNFDNDD